MEMYNRFMLVDLNQFVFKLIHDNETVQKTFHDKILKIRQTIAPEKLEDITTRIMQGELTGHEFDNVQLRMSLSYLVPEYEPSDNDKEPVILKIRPEARA